MTITKGLLFYLLVFLPVMLFGQETKSDLKLSIKQAAVECNQGGTFLLDVKVYNGSDSSYVLYNFNKHWNEAAASFRPKDYTPGEPWYWDAGLNIALISTSDSIQYFVGKDMLVDPAFPDSMYKFRKEAIERVRQSRVVLHPMDSIGVVLTVPLKRAKWIPKGRYSLTVYYEINKYILKYVPNEPNLFMGRLRSSEVTLIIN